MGLREYKAKRNFARTREPAGKVHTPSRTKARAASFVVQKHDATRLHYDFRLEMEGVLKSWAIPKGFPHRRGDRRLAVQVEDHPLEYGAFEGTIPEGNYGAGTVMLWDRGTYIVSGDDPLASLAGGKLHFWLKGRKLKGEWALVRLRGAEEKPQWLLLKSGEDGEPVPPRLEDLSVKSSRTLEEISHDRQHQWRSAPPDERSRRPSPRKPWAQSRRVSTTRPDPVAPPTGLPKGAPAFVEPMKALLCRELPRGPEWIYEIKFDGIRLLAVRKGKTVTLLSRTRNDLTAKYPELARELATLSATEFVLDGELVALDEAGRSSFQLLQSWHQSPPDARPPLVYYVFDLLHASGRDVRGLPLCERKEFARKLAETPAGLIRFSAGIDADSESLVREMKARGLEGVIAKRRDSVYEAGRRSGAWVKFKWSAEQEFVIGGYTRPKGGRMHFGALLVGYYQGGKLMFAGKVGTGFDEQRLRTLHRKFQGLLRPDCPFANLPESASSRFGGGMTASQMRLCTWLNPELVCQVRFTEWTRDHHLRQPSFLALREDKPARRVVRETAGM